MSFIKKIKNIFNGEFYLEKKFEFTNSNNKEEFETIEKIKKVEEVKEFNQKEEINIQEDKEKIKKTIEDKEESIKIRIENKTQERYFYEYKKFYNSTKQLEQYIKEEIKDRKQLSKLKNGLKLANKCDYETEKIIDKQLKLKPKYKKKPEEPFMLKNKQNAINRMKNKKLKLAFRLAIISGLRISELANLEKNNITIDKDNKMKIYIKGGKGDKDRTIECIPDKYVLEGLINLKENKKGKLFYSTKYLSDNAKKLDFHTHDLRKTYANIVYENIAVRNKKERIEYLQEQLGHNKNSKTYLKYINRNIVIDGTKYTDMDAL